MSSVRTKGYMQVSRDPELQHDVVEISLDKLKEILPPFSFDRDIFRK
jgi:hypothetical protein